MHVPLETSATHSLINHFPVLEGVRKSLIFANFDQICTGVGFKMPTLIKWCLIGSNFDSTAGKM